MNKQIFLLGFFLIVFSSVSLATCWFQGSLSACSLPNGNSILLANGHNNSQVANLSETDFVNYDKKLCCNTTDLGSDYVLAGLTDYTNSHVDISGDSANYPVEIRITTPVVFLPVPSPFTPRAICVVNGYNDCLFGLSGQTNAHIQPCQISDPEYTYAACLDPSGAGFPIDMKCGDVFVDGLQVDPACDDSVGSNPPTTSCNISNNCVYTPDGNNPQCHNFGDVIQNTLGRDIVCSNSSNWCPEGLVFDDVLGRCDYPLNVCDYGYSDLAFAPPSLSCNNTVNAFSFFVDSCFYDFNIVTPSFAPYQSACCYSYNWTNNTKEFQFFSPDDVIIY